MLHFRIPVKCDLAPPEDQSSSATLSACALQGPDLRLRVLTLSGTSRPGVTPGPSVAL